MAGVRFISLLFLYFCIYFVKAEECVVYNFENDVDTLLNNDKDMCATIAASWNVGNYSQNGIERPSPNSDSYLYPSSLLSCTSTFEFNMSAGGIVEFNVFMDSSSALDQVTVLVFQSIPGSSSAVVGTIFRSASDTNFVSGWQKLRIDSLMAPPGTFVGYITVLGMASDESSVMIDSFRYIPPNYNENLCIVYEEDVVTTTTERQETTTLRSDGIEDCVTYNFETDFEIRFTTDNYLCDGFLPWHLDNYTSIDIDSPNPESTVFMAPNEASSCISSFIFNMAPDGIIEANIFMKQVNVLDHIIVLAQKKTGMEYDTVAGFQMYYPENQVFVPGWNTLRFTLMDFTSFDGYLIFIGSADKSSIVLVDSVRYIPPLTPPDDHSCDLYSTDSENA